MSGYIERVKELRLVEINSSFHLSKDDLWAMFDVAKPIILDGHFELLSGKHSAMFFRFPAISQYPRYASEISKEMVACIEKIKCKEGKIIVPEIDVVLGPTSHGMFFAFDIASKLKKRSAYALFDEGTGKPIKKLAEGYDIGRGDKVLIINDMTTTGTGIDSMIKLVEEDYHAEVIGVCLFANRGIGVKLVEEIKNKVRFFHSIINIDMPSWPKDGCQLCKDGVHLILSKDIHHLPIYSREDEFERITKYQRENQYQRQESQPHCN